MNKETGKREEMWQPAAKAKVGEMGFLASLLNYPKDDITEDMIKKLKPIIDEEDFTVVRLKAVNTVAGNLCAWVVAMEKYYTVNLIVIPKKASLEIAEKEYAELNATLNEKKENLRIVQERVAKLQAQLKAA